MQAVPTAGPSTVLVKRPRSPALQEADSDGSSSSAEWNDLEDDQWLSKPEPNADAAGYDNVAMRRARSVTPEKITSLTPLKDDNVGMKLLKLMGWRPGGGLGATGSGRTDPIPLPSKMDGLGLGKASIETRMLDEAIARRPRVLDSMKIANETEEQRLARESAVASKAEIKAEVQDALAKFYCDICSKGYANVRQWEEHIQSYGHNHAKRKHELAMQSRNNKNKADEVNKRREKEKRREQQELERMVKAAGGVMPSSSAGPSAMAKGQSAVSTEGAQAGPPKKTGFFKVAASTTAIAPPVPHGTPPAPPSEASAPPLPPPENKTRPATSAPRFASSSSSSLASTFSGAVPSIQPSDRAASELAREWRPSNAPSLHPLLAGDVQASASYAKPNDIRSQRNDFFRKEEGPAPGNQPHEVPTAASSQRFSAKPSKSMAFVPSAGASSKPAASTSSPAMSLSKAQPRKKALDMGSGDEEQEENASLPTGRPKAQKGRIGFGFQ